MKMFMTLLTVEFITKISLLLTDCSKQRNNNTVQTYFFRTGDTFNYAKIYSLVSSEKN